MSRQSRELREERLKLWERQKALLDTAEKREKGKQDLTSEEHAEYQRLDAELIKLRERIERMEKSEALEAELSETRGRRSETRVESGVGHALAPAERDEEVNRAFRAWLDPQNAQPEWLESAERVGINVRARELQTRALSGTDTSAGGYSVPNEMMRVFWEAQLWFANIRPFATVLQTATGANLPVPTVDDTGNSGAIIAQNTAVATTADPTFGQVVLGAHKYSSRAVLVPVELLQDSFIDLATFLGRSLGTRIGRIQSTHFATGTGTGEPQGVVTVAGLGKEAAATNAITLNEVIDLQHSVNIAYRPNARFMMHDSIAAILRKLKDSNDMYLWQPSVQSGQPDRLFGVDVVINNGMESALTTNKKVVLYGDISSYYIRDAGPVILARAEERWIDNHQVGFLAFQRTDAKGLSSSAIKYLTTKTT